MNDSELWRRLMALRAESEALAPELRLPAARPAARRVPSRRIAAGALLAAGLTALALLLGRRGDPPRAQPSEEQMASELWATPSDALLAPVAFDLARSVPDFSTTVRRTSTSTSRRNTP